MRDEASGAVCSAHGPVGRAGAVLRELRDRLDGAACSVIVLFLSPDGDLAAIAAAAAQFFPGVQVVGCTSAGEISTEGYTEGEIVAVGFRASHMRAQSVLLTGLDALESHRIAELAARARSALPEQPGWDWEFALLLTDGLARREDQLLAALRLGIGHVPLFGGSAGDGLDFRRTFLLAEGGVHDNAAVLVMFRSRCPVRVFRFDHLLPTPRKMVVTEAVPELRLVRQINGAPAAEEYARLVGCAPSQLSAFVFAAHPVMVRVGGQHHVRAIQKVEANGDLTFYSAIDEGLVLTLAEPSDIAGHLAAALAELSRNGRPEAIIGCDCILRRLEAEQSQQLRAMSRLLSAYRLVGFSTYGEQFNTVHVNQTLTGVAIYPPEDAP